MRGKIAPGASALLSLFVGCGGGPGADPSASARSPAPTRTPTNVTLPADWDLPFPAGTVIQAVNWGEPTKERDRVQLVLPATTDGLRYFRAAFVARGLTVVERVTDGSSHFLEADGGPGRESFGVELPRSGVVLVSRWRPTR